MPMLITPIVTSPQPGVTSNLVSQIQIGDHGRGRDALLHSKSSRFQVLCLTYFGI